METPQHLFALSRKEQRVVILIMILLISMTAARAYWHRRSRPVLPAATKVERTIPLDEESTPSPNER